MIAKIMKGSDFKGVVYYILNNHKRKQAFLLIIRESGSSASGIKQNGSRERN